MTDIGPSGPFVVERQTVKVVEVVLEGVQRRPLGAGQASEEQPFSVPGSWYEHGIDVVPEGGHAPSLRLGRRARWHAIEERAQDFRKAQASVDEQRGRLPR